MAGGPFVTWGGIGLKKKNASNDGSRKAPTDKLTAESKVEKLGGLWVGAEGTRHTLDRGLLTGPNTCVRDHNTPRIG